MHIFLQIFIGVCIGELSGAFFHWLEDTYLPYCTKIPILDYVAKHNELHHYYPRSVLAYPWYTTLAYTGALAVFCVTIVFLIHPKHFRKHWVMWLSAVLWASITGLTHKWSHYRDCELSPFYLTLVKLNILSGHDHHAVHHQTSDCRYAPSFPIFNYILDFLGIFKLLELVIPIQPSRKPGYNDYLDISTDLHKELEKDKVCPRVISLNETDMLFNKLESYYKCPLFESHLKKPTST